MVKKIKSFQRKIIKMRVLNIVFICISFSVFSQKTIIDNEIYEGNEKLKKENYLGAEIDYRLALSKSPDAAKALFNLGNTQFKADAYDEAAQQFFKTQKFSDNKFDKHAALHNMGNVYMKKKQYEKAVESYKAALRNNPSDDETRYNYALAKSLLEDEKKSQDKNNQKKDNQKNNEENDKSGDDDQNKKSSDPEDNSDNDNRNKKDDKSSDKDKKEGNSNDKNEKPLDEKDLNKKRAPGKLSKEQVKSLLEAMNNQEKNVQDKINAKKIKGKPIKTKKDW